MIPERLDSKIGTKLLNTPVLILDIQATAAHCAGGHMLEIGWMVWRADADPLPAASSVAVHRIRLPEGVELSSTVAKMTGLTEADLADASSPETVWHELEAAAKAMARPGPADPPLCIIHYARFEMPFLVGWHRTWGREPFPVRVVCTHETARRLLPQLPRRGLRALAGYFGHAVSAQRRCDRHVQATAVVWKHLLGLLREGPRIETADSLTAWLEKPRVGKPAARVYPMASRIRADLPDRPGVYRMLRADGSVLAGDRLHCALYWL